MDKTLRPNFSARSRFVLTGIMLALAVSARAGTITVTNTDDSGAGSLRQAISDAAAGDTINFSVPANAIINLFSGELLIDKSLTIAGPGANALRVQNDAIPGNFRVFEIKQPAVNVIISGLSIAEGNADFGGGIYSHNVNLTIASCFVFANTAASEGGGIFFDGDASLTIANSTIWSNNTTGNVSYGGGVVVSLDAESKDEQATIINSTISGNRAVQSGGGVVYLPFANTPFNQTLALTNTTVTDNESKSAYGGGVYNGDGLLSVQSSIIAGNIVPAGNPGPDFYGTLHSLGYNLIGNPDGATINGITTGNQTNVNPKLDTLKDNGGPTLTHALLSGSPAIDAGNSGGAIFDQRDMARPVDSPSVPNASGGDGSDIGAYEVQPDQLPGCNTINTIVNNNGDNGAGTLRYIIANVCNGSNITFANNVRGAIDLTSGELAINKSLTINGPGANLLTVQRSPAADTPAFRIFNIASGYTAISGLTIANGNVPGGLDSGGGILNNGALTLTSVTVSGNSAAFGGGGISNAVGTLNLINSTIMSNSANNGGGISGGTLNCVNSTFSLNTARTGNGGAITVGTASLINTTIANNSAAGSGGGIFNNGNNGASVRARNTLIALNRAASARDVSGALTSDDFNLISDGSGATITPARFADQIGSTASPINPQIGFPQDNGGGTPTYELLSGSPAIDKGHSSGSATDQRALPRPVDRADIPNAEGGDGADIGAFEVQAPAPTPTPAPSSTPSPTPAPSPTPTPTAAPVTTLANISTRLRVETGDNVLIGGFIVTGSQPKKVIIRAIGPSLTDFGIQGALANPTLELFEGSTSLATNDDWGSSPQQAEIAASGLAPGKAAESAIIATLTPNQNYTAVVRGKDGGTGIAVVEAFDLDHSAASKLGNISTRGFVDVDDNVMIAGLIINSDNGTSLKVLVRALGPTLGDFGVAGVLVNPTLDLVNSSGTVIRSNDNWKDSQRTEIEAANLGPNHDEESALVQTLPPGAYTAIVRGSARTTGVGLVEVYDIP